MPVGGLAGGGLPPLLVVPRTRAPVAGERILHPRPDAAVFGRGQHPPLLRTGLTIIA